MRKYFYLILYPILLCFFFSVTSCNNDSNTEPIVIDSVSNINGQAKLSDTSKNSIDSKRIAKEEEYLKNLELKKQKSKVIELVAKEKNLTKDELKAFLPENLQGFDQIPASAGKTVENDTAVTIYVRKQFRDVKNKRTILFDIFDYGRGNKVLNSHIYEKVPDDLDAPAYPYKTSDAKGFFYWLEEKVYGHIEVLVDNRFVVMIRLNGFSRDDKSLEKYLNMINIKSLIKKAN